MTPPPRIPAASSLLLPPPCLGRPRWAPGQSPPPAMPDNATPYYAKGRPRGASRLPSRPPCPPPHWTAATHSAPGDTMASLCRTKGSFPFTASIVSTLRNHVDRSFLAGLVALFASEDPRERDRLKTVYHQLYSKLTVERAFRQRTMAVALLRFVYGTSPAEPERHCGVGELLEICGSIINGFVVPLKEEHRAFMARVLLPLHRTRCVHTCHRQLSYYGSIRRPGTSSSATGRRPTARW
ncbi:hypothetical protein OsJ_23967 [Oryza sativa Japonica Group]|uniref:Uncharacterized protein n=4 Tax=Oryza TaxID=4527 RepID=B9FWU4_ORYSJ|nr:hypothetical protein OsJ_23967 [Oryza sativa Japonica Group]